MCPGLSTEKLEIRHSLCPQDAYSSSAGGIHRRVCKHKLISTGPVTAHRVTEDSGWERIRRNEGRGFLVKDTPLNWVWKDE